MAPGAPTALRAAALAARERARAAGLARAPPPPLTLPAALASERASRLRSALTMYCIMGSVGGLMWHPYADAPARWLFLPRLPPARRL